jgi:iron(III) transport system substrate-binding protein
MKLRYRLPVFVLWIGTLSAQAASAAEVNVYTTREPGLFAPLAADFTARTGIKVNTVFVKDGLAERVAAEGAGSPADLLMTVDIGNLVELVDKGVTRPVTSPALAAAVPPHLRAPDGAWVALSLRARLVWADTSLGLTNIGYEDLADPKWKGKVCIRSGQHPYNVALVAAMIAHAGEARTEAWLTGLKANLARKPGGGDRDVARDILGGLCQIGVGNSYYVGLMRSGKGGAEQKTWGEKVAVVLPVFAGGGTHVNASGAALARHAPNAAEAEQLLAYLLSPEGQKIYAEQNFEYPVRADAAVDPIIAALGKLTPDTVPLAEIARHRKAASLLIDKVGFDR